MLLRSYAGAGSPSTDTTAKTSLPCGVNRRCQTLCRCYRVSCGLAAWSHPCLTWLRRVTLVKHPRHLHGSDEARVICTLSDKIINVTRAGEILEDALYAVFDVLERALTDFRSLRRGVSKYPGPRVRGRIVRLNAVHGMPFDALQVDTVVDLDIEAGHQGPQATRVTPHWP